MKLVYFTSILIVLLLILAPGILGLGIHKIPSGYQPALTDSQAIDQENSIKQTFAVQNNGLSGIGLSIKNPYFRNQQELEFDLLNSQNHLIRQVILNGRGIADGNFLIISFDPVTDSASKNYSFTLSAPGVVPDQALEVYHSQQHPPADEQYFVNGQLENGETSYVYYWSPQNTLTNFVIIYRNWLQKFAQDFLFAIFYSLLIILGASYLIYHYGKRKIS